jgi:dTDP-4-dehydrorhamnose reductase
MKLLVFGKAGQVARELASLDWPADSTVTFLGHDDCDLAVAGSAARAIEAVAPDIVINAAAYTAVDKAESEQGAAFALNAAAPGEMAVASARAGVALLHVSTDYVFDGSGAHAHREDEPIAPLSIYGASKAEGEARVRAANPRHVILRTSWVFSGHGANFVRTMLRLGAEREELAIVDDQVGGPTGASDIAAALRGIARKIAAGEDAYGTYHFAGAPAVSWHGFAEAIFARAAARGLKVPARARKIATADYPTPARRPLNSRLDCGAILRDWGIAQPQWGPALDRSMDILALKSH